MSCPRALLISGGRYINVARLMSPHMSVFGTLEHAWKAYREGNVHDAELWDNVNLRDTPLLLEEYQDGHIDRAEALRLHSRLVGTQRPDDPDNVRLGLFNMNRGDQQRTMNQLVALPHTQNKLENFRILLKYTTLTTLKIKPSGDDTTLATQLADALRQNFNTNIKSLKVSECFEALTIHLAAALRHNTTLTTLELESEGTEPRDIEDRGAVELADALLHNTTLKKLALAGVVATHVTATMRHNNTTLTYLKMNRAGLDDQCALNLAEALRTNTTLITLDLGNNSIGVIGAMRLADALIGNTTLTTLDLHTNDFEDEGTKLLAAALHRNTTLKTLNLSDNIFGNEGAENLAHALRHNATLTTLDISNNIIGVIGMKWLCEALITNKTLTTLNVFSCGFGKDGVRLLGALLDKNHTLKNIIFNPQQSKAIDWGIIQF